MECVFNALSHCTGDTVDQLKRWFGYGEETTHDGKPVPPSVHDIIDYFMELGGSLTPIARRPVDVHLGVEYPMDSVRAANRWDTYCDIYKGLLIGRRAGIGHMAYIDKGRVWDPPDDYHFDQCENYSFFPETFMVLTWQA